MGGALQRLTAMDICNCSGMVVTVRIRLQSMNGELH